MHTVAMLVYPGVQSLDVTGPLDVFAEANRFLEPADRYVLSVLGLAAGPVNCSNGLTLQPQCAYADCHAAPDLLLLPGGPELPGMPRDAALCAWLQDVGMCSGRIASVCNGAFLLAHAGLLDGLRATTHWNDATKLAARFPRVVVEPDRIFLRQGRVYTSAGVTAGIDLALHLLYEDWGQEVALNVARRLLVFSQRNGGQSQFSPYLTPYSASVSPVQAVHDHVRAHLSGDLSIARLAQVAAMSARHFARVFVQETHGTPAAFVERCRVDAARAMLDTGTQPLKTIAHRCGFGATTRMRMAFVKQLAVTPQQYRLNFGAFAA